MRDLDHKTPIHTTLGDLRMALAGFNAEDASRVIGALYCERPKRHQKSKKLKSLTKTPNGSKIRRA